MASVPKRIDVMEQGIVDTEIFIMLQAIEMNEVFMRHGKPQATEAQVREQLTRVYNNSRDLDDVGNILRIMVKDRYQARDESFA